MLKELQIRDFALIEDVQLTFYEGLSVLTGETGAGKSIIIDALSLLLGARASSEMIRTGSESAQVEGLFATSDQAGRVLSEWGIDYEDEFIISREIHRNGRNRCRLNGQLVTVNQLTELGEHLADILGQHDHQSLLDPNRHIMMLDAFGDANFQALKATVREKFDQYQQVRTERLRLQTQERDRLARIDLLKFQTEEINMSNLEIGEEEELRLNRQRLANVERITTTAESVYTRIQGQFTDQPALYDQLGQVVTELTSLVRYDETIKPILEFFEQALFQLEEGSRNLRQYTEGFDRDPHALEQVEERLILIENLKRKYGEDEAAILNYAVKISEELETLLNSETTIERLEAEEADLEAKLKQFAEELTKQRQKFALDLEQNIENQLADLNMTGTKFLVSIEKTALHRDGADRVEFLISPNVGEELKPLAKIASGGEMSRIMLALKNTLVKIDPIPTLVFDEVDSGIGGRTAAKIGEKLRSVSEEVQVFAVTHLPVVASFAKHHFYVEKQETKGRTVVTVTLLDKKGQIAELVRMLGGKADHSITTAHAKELLKQANTS